MGLYVKNSGSFVPPNNVYVKDGGVWNSSTQVYVHQGGFWYPMFAKLVASTGAVDVDLFTLFGSPTVPLTAVYEIASGVTISSSSSSNNAITASGFPAGSIINIINAGTITGAGGAGGDRVDGSGRLGASKPGIKGGTAIYTRNTTFITNTGTIAGGGGGGGGGGRTNRGGESYDDYTGNGGGGAGTIVGSGGGGAGSAAASGTSTTGGSGNSYYSNPGSSEQQYGSSGGAGGGLGQPGSRGLPNPDFDGTNLGGAAGNAIDGISYTTKTVSGTILGLEVG